PRAREKGDRRRQVARGHYEVVCAGVVQGVDRRRRRGAANEQGQRFARVQGADRQDRPRQARPAAGVPRRHSRWSLSSTTKRTKDTKQDLKWSMFRVFRVSFEWGCRVERSGVAGGTD